LPEEWLIERIQQVGANSRNLLSPSFVVVCRIFAAVFRHLRDRCSHLQSLRLNWMFPVRDFPDPDFGSWLDRSTLRRYGRAIPGGVFDDFLVDLNIWTGSPTADLAKSLSMA